MTGKVIGALYYEDTWYAEGDTFEADDEIVLMIARTGAVIPDIQEDAE